MLITIFVIEYFVKVVPIQILDICVSLVGRRKIVLISKNQRYIMSIKPIGYNNALIHGSNFESFVLKNGLINTCNICSPNVDCEFPSSSSAISSKALIPEPYIVFSFSKAARSSSVAYTPTKYIIYSFFFHAL